MALLPENKNDQIKLMVCVGALGLVYLFYTYMYTPKTTELDTLEERVESLHQSNEQVRQEVVRGTVGKLKEEAEMYGQLLQQMRQLVPVSNEVPTLLEQISNAARQTGLDVGGITPLGIIPGEVFDTHRYRMTVQGSYHRIGHFLDNVGSLTRIMAPMNLTLRPSNRTSRNAREQLLEAGFEVQTYVAKTRPPAPPLAPGAGGGQ